MNGELTDDCLADVLRRIYTQRASGVLNLKQGNERRSLFFESGAMVFASSNNRQDRLGESMMRYGLLSVEDFYRASTSVMPGKRFGQVLVELGMCDPRDLSMNVQFQILDIIYSLFEWTAGSYEFIPAERCVPDDLRLDLSTANLILEGVRRIKDFGAVERGLGDVNCLIGPSSNPLLRLQSLSLKPLERHILETVVQPTAIFEIVMTTGGEPQAVSRAVYGLISAGLLERFGQGKLNRKTGKLQIPKPLLVKAAQAPPIAPLQENATQGVSPGIERQLAEMREKLAKTFDPCEILGVTWSSTQDEIRDAYFALAKDFHPDRHQSAPREVRQEVEHIFTRLTGCYEMLRAQAPPSPPPAPSIMRVATQPPPSSPSAERPITQPLPPSPVQPAFPTPQTLTPLPSVTPTPATVTALETAAQREQRAEAMYIEARNRYISKDFVMTAQLMKEVVRLNPTQGRYFLLLGNALASQPKTLKEAEPVLKKAQELDPFNVMCRSSLGLVYVRAGMPRQAENEFREALKLDPTHAVSLRELDKLKTQQSEGGFLNRLFK